MAIKVIITSVSPFSSGNPVTVNMQLISDYESPIPFGAIVSASVPDANSQTDAIRKALDELLGLADQIKEGAQRAKDDHPIGS